MKKQILLSIVLIGLFSTVYSQDIYWVDNDGAATWAQAQSSTPLSGTAAASMTEANANAQPGDVLFMRGGNYSTSIKPANSGTSGSPITYQRYLEEDVVFDGISRCVDLIDAKSYIVVDGISCLNTTSSWVEVGGNSNYNTIKNSSFNSAYAYPGIGLSSNSRNTSILNNKLRGGCDRTTPYPGGPPNGQGADLELGGPFDLIVMNGSDYNLIDGNDFAEGGAHYAIGSSKGSYHIIRNNRFHNRLHGQLGLTSPTGGVGTVVENNLFLESGRDRDINFCGQPRDREMPPEKQNQIAMSHAIRSIIRGNVFIDGGNAIGFSNWRGQIKDVHIYNNTMYKNEVHYQMQGSETGTPYEGEMFVNNILAKAVQIEISAQGPGLSGNTICNNNIWDAGGAIQFGSNNTCNNSNLNIDPLFISEAAMPIESDLHLQASSPMINAGQWLTTITSASGSGFSFQVGDAKFFFDGYNFVSGDVIQLEGQAIRIRIVQVNYATNTLSVDRSITWTQGTGVSLPYTGIKPDMGAYQFVAESAESQSPNKGTAWELPGVLQAEHYDNGGEDIAYHDLTDGNNGGKYRADDVDLFAAGDLGGGYHVGDMEDGEWLEYSINVFTGGNYTLSTRIASSVGSGKYSISINGVDVTGVVDVPNTGGDQLWQSVSTDNISLTTGPHTLRLEVISGGFNLNYITVADTEAPTVPTALLITEVTSGSVSFSWTASTDNIGVFEYDIYKGGVLLDVIKTTEYTDNKLLAPGTTYNYTVVAKDAVGNESVQSDPVEGTTLQVQNITITSVEDKYTDDAPFDVEATVTTGLPLTYEVTGPATISGTTITLDGTTGTVEVTVTQAGDVTFGKTSKTTTFEVILITGIMEDQLPTLKIYPIPATDWLKIEGSYSDNAMVQVIDIMGKQVLYQSLRNNNISVSNLPEGVYLLNITDKGVSAKAKIIIQK